MITTYTLFTRLQQTFKLKFTTFCTANQSTKTNLRNLLNLLSNGLFFKIINLSSISLRPTNKKKPTQMSGF